MKTYRFGGVIAVIQTILSEDAFFSNDLRRHIIASTIPPGELHEAMPVFCYCERTCAYGNPSDITTYLCIH